MRYAMIMAGGSGTRLWPMSRREEPKQLLPFVGGRSLLQVAAGRLEGVVPAERRLICAAERYRSRLRQDLPEIPDANILGEPTGRDTLNAVGFGAAVLAARDQQATFAVLTADHLITPQEEFARRLDQGFRLVEADPTRLVTFGIQPTFPATGYGYVERGQPIAGVPGVEDACRATRFVEKPDRARAEEYLARGTFLWNSGMFIFNAATVLKAIEWFKPESARGLEEIGRAWREGGSSGAATAARRQVLERVYPTLPKISVDFALMEPAGSDPRLSIAVVPMRVQWMDVGSWPQYGETLSPDAAGNRTNARLTAVAAERVLAVSDDPAHVIAVVGCSNLIVVRTRDATLVCSADMAEKVKDVASQVPPAVQ